ncbi:uncharacterized protein [Henckelia pumila]|uniref:uncharacterized protein n=1 Tax=Henckelia pumila TaxID=405737 RepID=UPI003C6DD861
MFPNEDENEFDGEFRGQSCNNYGGVKNKNKSFEEEVSSTVRGINIGPIEAGYIHISWVACVLLLLVLTILVFNQLSSLVAAQGLSIFPVTPSCSSSHQYFREAIDWFVRLNPHIFSNYFVGLKLLIQSSRLNAVDSKRLGSTVATVPFSLPTRKTEGVATEKKPKFWVRAIKSFAIAKLEARKLKYPNTLTEALLMGILVEGTSLAAKFLRDNGMTLFKVPEETVKLLGMADLYVFIPEHPPLTEPGRRALDCAVDERMKLGCNGTLALLKHSHIPCIVDLALIIVHTSVSLLLLLV